MVRSVRSAVECFTYCKDAFRKGRLGSPVDAERLVEPVRERLRAFQTGSHHVGAARPQPAVGFLEDDIDPVQRALDRIGVRARR